MNIKYLADALAKHVENGFGDAEVGHVNGTGKTTVICGWELVTASAYEPHRGARQQPDKQMLKLFTTSRL